MGMVVLRKRPVVYPSSDGTPVGETEWHRDLIFDLIFVIKNLLRGQNAYVAGNLFLYYKEGNPRKVICPDVFVAFGVPQRRRKTYKSWQHGGKLPDIVFEFTSQSTWQNDLGAKRRLYSSFGVQEYFVFDPLREQLDPPLQGFELVAGDLLPMNGPQIVSRLLGVELVVRGEWLRLRNLATGELLPVPDELNHQRYVAEARQEAEAVARRQAEARQEAEAVARREAEDEVARLRAELERLRGSS